MATRRIGVFGGEERSGPEGPQEGPSEESQGGPSVGPQLATRRIGLAGGIGRVRRIGTLISSFPTTKAVAVSQTYNTVPRVWRTVADQRTGQTTSGQVNKSTAKRTSSFLVT